MARTFELPDLGEGIHEAEVQEILVSVGEDVAEGDPLLVVETDKAAVDIPAPYTGTVQEINVSPGDLVHVGDPMLTFGNGDTQQETKTAESEPEADATTADKEEKEEAEKETATQKRANGANGRPVPASPATRRLARELDVNLRQVDGSGPGGRVTAEDVRAFAEEEPAKAEPAEKEAIEPAEPTSVQQPTTAPELPDFSRWGEVERQPLRSVRRTIAQRMARAWSQIPHVTHHDSADVTELERMRQNYQDELELDSLTLTAFVMKTAVAALKEFPRFNASLDTDAGEIILKQYYHLGMAVDTDRGLIVPVIRDVDRKSITGLAAELAEVAQRTRAGEASLDEMQGGTFTITNVGLLGGDTFTPIINYPQAAILGMARAAWRPIVTGDGEARQITPRFTLPLILAFDHRIADGADAARFMNYIVAMLEDPDRLMLLI